MGDSKLTWANGSAVGLYSNAADGVVDLHFGWMRDYHLDGVLLQRFLSDIQDGPSLTQKNIILQHADAAASKHGRAYAVMWDITNNPGGVKTWADQIQADWSNHVVNYTKR